MGLGLWPQPGHPTPPPKFDRQPPRTNIRHARASSAAGERVDWCANSAPAPRAELTRAHRATTEPDPHAHEPAARPDRVPDELIDGGSVNLKLYRCRRRRPHGGPPPPPAAPPGSTRSVHPRAATAARPCPPPHQRVARVVGASAAAAWPALPAGLPPSLRLATPCLPCRRRHSGPAPPSTRRQRPARPRSRSRRARRLALPPPVVPADTRPCSRRARARGLSMRLSCSLCVAWQGHALGRASASSSPSGSIEARSSARGRGAPPRGAPTARVHLSRCSRSRRVFTCRRAVTRTPRCRRVCLAAGAGRGAGQ